jgi:hypothetical protein
MERLGNSAKGNEMEINKRQVTHATSNLGIWLNGKIGLYLEDLLRPFVPQKKRDSGGKSEDKA